MANLFRIELSSSASTTGTHSFNFTLAVYIEMPYTEAAKQRVAELRAEIPKLAKGPKWACDTWEGSDTYRLIRRWHGTNRARLASSFAATRNALRDYFNGKFTSHKSQADRWYWRPPKGPSPTVLEMREAIAELEGQRLG